ncbi:MAG: NAD-dependent epimerase/dehydratase family protein [Candidatus Anstonellales archaeon]
MRIIVIGGAGFIGSEMAGFLIDKGHHVSVIDNLRTGKERYITEAGKGKINFIYGDILNLQKVREAIREVDAVFHFAANADIRGGMENTFLDLEQNLIGTYNVLEAMRQEGVKKIVFASSSGIYGEPEKIPTPESYGPLFPTSLYGASKLGAEGYISAFCEAFGIQAWIFRLVNIVGARNSHGVIGDFIRKLRKNPHKLEILGNGKQQKSYLHVSDCISAIYFAFNKANNKINVFNLGNEDTISVKEVADIVCEEMGLKDVTYSYTGGERGWIGDAPTVLLSVEKLKQLGFKFSGNSASAVRRATREMLKETEIYDKKRSES